MPSFHVSVSDGTHTVRKRKVRVDHNGLTVLCGREEKRLPLARANFELGGNKVRLTDLNTGMIVTTDNPKFLDAIEQFAKSREISEAAKELRYQMGRARSARSSFKATAYDGTGEPRNGQILLDEKGLLFLSGKSRTTTRLTDVSIELGGKKRSAIRLKDVPTGLVITAEDPRLLDAISANGKPSETARLARQLRTQMTDLPRERLLQKTGLFVLAVGSCLIGWQLLNWFTELAVSHITPELEEQIAGAFTDKSYSSTSADALRVNKIGQRLIAKLPVRPYHFHFFASNDKSVNAFCLPGGNIIVLKGMLQKAKSDDELAGVIGHEIGHAIHRDVIRRTAHDLGFDVTMAMVFGSSAQQLKAIVDNARKLEHAKFSRDEEATADSTGVELACKAGYKGEAMATLFERLQSELSDPLLLVFMSDHPATAERIVAIKKTAEQYRARKKADGLKETDTPSKAGKAK